MLDKCDNLFKSRDFTSSLPKAGIQFSPDLIFVAVNAGTSAVAWWRTDPWDIDWTTLVKALQP